DGIVRSALGRVISGLPEPRDVELMEPPARAAALELFAREPRRAITGQSAPSVESELGYVSIDGNRNAESYRLVYRYHLGFAAPDSDSIITVDASDGRVISSTTSRAFFWFPTIASGATDYDGNQSFSAQFENVSGACRLRSVSPPVTTLQMDEISFD